MLSTQLFDYLVEYIFEVGWHGKVGAEPSGKVQCVLVSVRGDRGRFE